jgi:hypothetical protein
VTLCAESPGFARYGHWPGGAPANNLEEVR